MKTSIYTEAQIIAILRQAEGGVPGLTGASHQNSPFCPVADRRGICHVVGVGF